LTPASSKDPRRREGAISAFGSYLGECLVRSCGGRWVGQADGRWGVLLAGGFITFPFTKGRNFMDGRSTPGIAGWFEMLPLVARPQSTTIDVTGSAMSRPWGRTMTLTEIGMGGRLPRLGDFHGSGALARRGADLT
jgi:hypothetical protein